MRPDLVVHLPGGAHVVVDAKVPLDAFLRANEAEDERVARPTWSRTRAPAADPHRPAGQAGVLAPVRPVAGLRRRLRARRFARRGRLRAGRDLIEYAMSKQRDDRDPDDAHRAAADLRPGLARRGDGRERPGRQGPRRRALRAPPGAGRPLLQDAPEPDEHRRGVQRRRGLARVPGPRHGQAVPRAVRRGTRRQGGGRTPPGHLDPPAAPGLRVGRVRVRSGHPGRSTGARRGAQEAGKKTSCPDSPASAELSPGGPAACNTSSITASRAAPSSDSSSAPSSCRYRTTTRSRAVRSTCGSHRRRSPPARGTAAMTTGPRRS